MLKNIKIEIFTTVLLCVLFWSCSEDQGNYDYVDINEVQFEGIDESYTALLGLPFEITPNLVFTQDVAEDENRYTYEWIAMRQGDVLISDVRTDLATTKNLDLQPLTLAPGSYNVRYRVTDSDTGVQWSTSFFLNVESSIYEGWLLMNDVNGEARLDMVSKVAGTYQPIYDVLEKTGSALELKGAPVNVYCYPYDPQFYGIYVTTEGNGTTKIDPESFDWQIDYYLSFEMISNVATDFKADFIQELDRAESLMYKDGDFYYYLRVYNIRYGLPINIMSDEAFPFEAAPFIGLGFGPLHTTLFYDNTNKRFVRQRWSGQNCNLMPEGTLFDYNTGMDLLFMQGSEYNGGEVFALLQDPNNSKLFLARMSSYNANINQVYYQEVPSDIAASMAQGKNFAVNPDFGYLFYNVGGKVYEYDFNIKQAKLMLDKGAEEITLMKFQEESPFSNKLFVASYNEASANGTMELYAVPPVNGDLIKEDSYSGFDKIISAAYRVR